MEKDKLSILDVCGAYGQKDIERLDRGLHALPESAERWTKNSWNSSVWPL